MRRRDLIAEIGGAVAWPLSVRAKQGALPVVEFVSGWSRRLQGALTLAVIFTSKHQTLG